MPNRRALADGMEERRCIRSITRLLRLAGVMRRLEDKKNGTAAVDIVWYGQGGTA